jgi:hypothetical protein
MDAFVALLLSRFFSLQRLTMGPNFTTDAKFLGLFLRATLFEKGSFPDFERLQDVVYDYHLNYRLDTGGKNTTNVIPFFYLPNVSHLSIALDNPITFKWPTIMPPNPSSITSLDVFMLRETHLHHLLSVTSGLRILRWELYYHKRDKHATCTPMMELDKLASALNHVRETLKELTISTLIEERTNYQRTDMQFNGSLSKLRHFDQLRHLQLPFEFLVASLTTSGALQISDVAPRYLGTLTITDELVQNLGYEGFGDPEEWPEAVFHHFALWLQCRQLPSRHFQKLVFRAVEFKVWYTVPPDMTESFQSLAAQEGFEVEFQP